MVGLCVVWSEFVDIVYLCREGENEELRYSLRSLSNVPHGRVWLFGGAPPWYDGTVVATDQSGAKYRVTTRALRAALDHPEVSDPFVLMNDDFYITEPIHEVPHLHRGPVSEVIEDYKRRRGYSTYLAGMEQTRDLIASLSHHDPLSYELHVPMVIHKALMREALDIGAHLPVLHKRTLYGNLAGLGGEQIADVKVWSRECPIPSGPWLSSDDSTLGYLYPLLAYLFPEPSEWEAVTHLAPCTQSEARLPRRKERPMYRVPRRIYETVNGRTVLKYPAGARIPLPEAERLGLIGKPKPAPQPAPKPDYSERTVAELKGLLDERGVTYTSKANKAALIALLEA